MPGDAAQSLGIARQDALKHLKQHEQEKPDAAEQQDTDSVSFPGHLLVPADPEQLVDAVFTRDQNTGQEHPFPVHHFADVAAERNSQCHQYQQIQPVLQNGLDHD